MYALEAIRFCADKKPCRSRSAWRGYDDISYAQYSTPRLTTIKQDVQKKAQKAVEILLKWIEEGERISAAGSRTARDTGEKGSRWRELKSKIQQYCLILRDKEK